MGTYDYRKDPQIAKAAEKNDKVEDVKQYDDYITGGKIAPVPLYDLEYLSTNFTLPPITGVSEIIGSFLAFEYVLSGFFRTYWTNDETTVENIEWAIKGALYQVFTIFKTKITTHFKEYNKNDIEEWLYRWKSITIEIIQECFEQFPFSLDIYGKEKDNFNLLYQSVNTVQYNYLVDVYQSYSHPIPDIILYNFWGDDYTTYIQDESVDKAPTQEGAERTDHIYNTLRFSGELCKKTKDAVENRIQLTDLRSFIQGLFSEYTKLLRIYHYSETPVIRKAVKHWEVTSCDIVENDLYIMSQQYRLCDYHIGDIVHPKVFRSSRINEWNAIQEIKTILKNHIHAITISFVSDVESWKTAFKWANELDALHINYHEHFDIMSTYFHDVPFLQFRYCIESADLTYLYDHLLDNNKSYGAFRFYISTIGSKCKSWLEVAAATLKDSNGATYNSRTLKNSVFANKNYARELIEAFRDKNVDFL